MGLFIPALIPKCATYVEDGANFIEGKQISKLLKVSTDGYLKCQKHENNFQCSEHLKYEHYDMIIKCKCPFPNEFNIPVHYSLPIRYVTQTLAGMHAKRVMTCLYISYLKNSTTFLKCTFDKNLWNILWNATNDLYDVDHVLKPNHLHENVLHLKDLLQKYVDNNVEFKCELPSQIGLEDMRRPY